MDVLKQGINASVLLAAAKLEGDAVSLLIYSNVDFQMTTRSGLFVVQKKSV